MPGTFPDFFAKWLPAVAQPFGLSEAAKNLTAPLNARARAEHVFRSTSSALPANYGYAALLHPERSPVPFEFRDEDVDDFTNWALAMPDGSPKWRLLTGEAGRGKTRLLMGIVESLNGSLDRPWRAGFLNLPHIRTTPSDLLCLRELNEDLFLVVDYAERFENEITAIMNTTLAIAADRPDRRVCLVMVSRVHSELWRRIAVDNREIGEFVGATPLDVRELSPLGDDLAIRRKVFETAYASFETHFKEERPLQSEPNLTPEDFKDVLLIHMAALSLHQGDLRPDELTQEKLLRWVLDRERRLWNEMVDGKGLPRALRGAPMEQAATYLTMVTLAEGITLRQTAIQHLENCPELNGLDAPTLGTIAEIFHELYPGPGWVNGVTPDLIGTFLLNITDDAFIGNIYANIN